MNDRNRPSSGVVPNSPGAREALQKEGKLVVSGAVFLHGNDAWLFVEDHMLVIRFTEEAIADKKHEITARAGDDFTKLLAARDKAVLVKPSVLTKMIQGDVSGLPTIARKVGSALVCDNYIHATRMHGEVSWFGTDEFSPVYAVVNGETVAVLFPFTPLPAAKA